MFAVLSSIANGTQTGVFMFLADTCTTICAWLDHVAHTRLVLAVVPAGRVQGKRKLEMITINFQLPSYNSICLDQICLGLSITHCLYLSASILLPTDTCLYVFIHHLVLSLSLFPILSYLYPS